MIDVTIRLAPPGYGARTIGRLTAERIATGHYHYVLTSLGDGRWASCRDEGTIEHDDDRPVWALVGRCLSDAGWTA